MKGYLEKKINEQKTVRTKRSLIIEAYMNLGRVTNLELTS
jgi:hypothetical protein